MKPLSTRAADIYKRVLPRHETHAAINVYLAMCYYHLEYFDISSELLATYLATSDGHSNVAKNLLACNTFHLVDGVAAEKSLHLHLPQPTALVYLKSIAMYHVHDDAFNWNYGVALAATGMYSAVSGKCDTTKLVEVLNMLEASKHNQGKVMARTLRTYCESVHLT
ncbi:hypothetical protein DYB37_002133 [Aphanomyces astaci]|uniref:Uncharacterized protein n=1 Tax=Aphanomyces astaci TaxID=112090 RepID=A0A418F4D4_APHAT|nr:hypothetical protein DYB37_002133 [Aphanomyces astaci]